MLVEAGRNSPRGIPPIISLIVMVTFAFGWSAADEPDDSKLAEARSHWSFQPVIHPEPPRVRTEGWVRNEIDRFILKRLEAEQVEPSPAADRVTLLRRLFLDLTGLPPNPDDVDMFLSDRSDKAYETVVDRLLKSPHYGERWGRYWLDMARYADSNGYEADQPRPHAWRWRDWVINALNADMPFDQFTIEQIAGDLLPGATIEQRVATGFHRNTLLNTEGGVDREEDRVKRTVDRTNTLGKVWLGLTLECCQCHSHKYDPITQHEYFSVYSFFNSLDEPDIAAPTAEQIRTYRTEFAAWRKAERRHLKAIADYQSGSLRKWEESLPKPDGPSWRIVNPKTARSARPKTTLEIEDDLSIFVTGPNNQADTYTIQARTRLTGITAIRVEALADERLPAKGPGLAGNGNFVLSSVRIFAKPADDTNSGRGKRYPIAAARADFSQGGRQVSSVPGDNPTDGWAVYPKVGKSHFAVFELHEPIQRAKNDGDTTLLTIELDHQAHHDHNLGRFRLSVATAPQPVPDDLPNSALVDIRASPAGQRTGSDVLRLVRFFDYHEDGLDRLLDTVMEHHRQRPQFPDTMAQTVAELPTPRMTRVHERGDFLDKGDVVDRVTPTVLPPMAVRGEQPDRLDLAHWLVSDSNPLTARVIVNRVWQQHFGRGLVATDDDFGTQGEAPSHPELLDWLASRFRKDGWSLKKLHRLIVTSATWRQSSIARPELEQRDPYNTWLARQNRLRVEAEIIRDLVLASSGLLRSRVGGPSVRPPQPDDLVKLGFQKSLDWTVSEGPDRYRRGLYTFFQRTVPYPMLVEFDVADSNTSCTRRERSNTPLQALTLWNDPVIVECARALGRRIVVAVPEYEKDDSTTASRRVEFAFRLCLSRQPTEREQAVLTMFYKNQLQRYAAHPTEAHAFVGRKDDSDAAAVAASVGLARTIINLDEFITRE